MRLVTPELHYPITVTKLLRQPRDEVQQNAPLFDYQYKSKVVEGSQDNKEGELVERTFPATFESYVEGTVTEWFIKPGQVITKRGTRVCEIEEFCAHDTQYGGMCVDCGRDLTTISYNTVVKDTARATINTVHGHTALLVSQQEANRSDEEAKRRLISSRKLSLVVDLDQTIIQATVDPTVAEWQADPSNPNHGAVKDVRAFQLVDDGPGARGCWYYIKLRPGLEDFLAEISKFYELHIYTMGTRAYAQNIAKIVDPDRKIFADRILSRDESGSLTSKNLKRLFPVDTKMVVIIDDRGDVWQWSQNLIKVRPYDFFVGIGDINSSFLPKRPELEAVPPKPEKAAEGIAEQDQALKHDGVEATDKVAAKPTRPHAEHPTEPQTNGDVSAIDQLVSMGGGNDPSKLKEQTSEQDEAIAAQLADRPLLQKQKILDENEQANGDASGVATENGEQKPQNTQDAQPQYRHNLLVDDDTELLYLGQSLRKVQQSFFDEYDRKLVGSQGGRLSELRPGANKKRGADDLDILPDVTGVMASMKQKVLKGVSVVFSGVVPLGVDVQNHDLAVWAKSFGATITENVTKRTTHVIASPQRRTAKVRQAARKPDRISIVTQQWLFDCLSQWRRVDPAPYRIHTEIAEDGEKAGLENGLPFEGNMLLSDSDEGSAVTDEESDTPTSLSLQTDSNDEAYLAAQAEALGPKNSPDEGSPTEETTKDWSDMNDELADFLGSDAEDASESEAESSKLDDSDLDTPTSSAKKRKRDSATTDGEDSDASVGSRLERRKRKALARTSSLTGKAITLNRTSEKVDTNGASNSQEADDETDEDDAALQAELEAEMLRQAEEDGDD